MSNIIKFKFSELNTGTADNDSYRIYRNEITDPCPNGIRDESKEIHSADLTTGENIDIEYTDSTGIENRSYVYRVSLYRISDDSEIMSPALGPFLFETSNTIGYPLAKFDDNSVNYKLTKKPITWEDFSDGNKRFIDAPVTPTPPTGASTWSSSTSYSTGDYIRYQTSNTSNGSNGWEVYKALVDISSGGDTPDTNSSWQIYTTTAMDQNEGDFANTWYTYRADNNTYYVSKSLSDTEAYFNSLPKNSTFGVDLQGHTKPFNIVPFYKNPNFSIVSKKQSYHGDSPTIVSDFAEGQNACVDNVYFDDGFTFISLFANVRSDAYRKQADGIIYSIEMFSTNGLAPGSFMSLNQNYSNQTYFNLSSLLFSNDTPTVALNPWLKKQEDQIQAGSLTRSNDYPGLPRALSEYTALDYHWKNPAYGIGAYQMRCGYNTTANYNLNSGGGWSSGAKNFRSGSTAANQYLGTVTQPDGSTYNTGSLDRNKLHTLVITEKHGLTKTFINGHLAHTNESEMDPQGLKGCLTNINSINNSYLGATNIENYCPQWHNAGITNPTIPYPGFHVKSSAGDGQFNFKHNYHNMNEVASTFMAHSAPIEDILNFIGYYQNHTEIGPHIESQLTYIGF